MKTLYILPLILLFSCNKEEPTPPAEMTFKVNNVEIEGFIPALREQGGEYHLTGSTQDETHLIEIDLGAVILGSYTMDPGPIQGDQDPVYVTTSGSTYTLIDSAGFNVTMTEQEGRYSGSYHGTLYHPVEGSILINSTFENL